MAHYGFTKTASTLKYNIAQSVQVAPQNSESYISFKANQSFVGAFIKTMGFQCINIGLYSRVFSLCPNELRISTLENYVHNSTTYLCSFKALQHKGFSSYFWQPVALSITSFDLKSRISVRFMYPYNSVLAVKWQY